MERKEFRTLVAATLAQLAGAWQLKPENEEYTYPFAVAVDSESGIGLHFGTEYNKPGRIVVNGENWPAYIDGSTRHNVRPRDVEYHATTPEITCAANRGPEAIARDIERRLMPELRAWFPRCRAQAERHQKYHDDKSAALERLRASVGHVTTDRQRQTDDVYARNIPGSVLIEFRSASDVVLRHISASEAIAMLHTLRALRIKEGAA